MFYQHERVFQMNASSLRAVFVILAVAAAGLAGMVTGCDGLNDCQEAQAQIQAKIDSCHSASAVDHFVRVPLGCTDEAGTLALCQAAAFRDASCDCTGFGDINTCTPTDAQAFKAASEACK